MSVQATLEQLDQQIADLLADWSLTTTLLALLLVALLAYPLLYPDEPDTHPLLLARQSAASPIRNKHESSTYRSPETPYGFPLKTGLNVKDPGAPRWASGRDGDLRDIWREVQRGGSEVDGKLVPRGRILTVLGKEEVVEHTVEDLSCEMGILGRHWKSVEGVERVAVYLPNSVEYLCTIFACAFYGLTPILIPANLPPPTVLDLLNTTSADALVCEAGNLPLDDVAKHCPHLRHLTWVVEKTSRHVDWNGAPSSRPSLTVTVWHDLIHHHQPTSTPDLPPNSPADHLGALITIWPHADPTGTPTLTTFTHANLIAATAALLTALPLRQRLSPTDLFLPTDSLSHTYTLCHTLATLHTHASLALTSVAGPGTALPLASLPLSPTILLAPPDSLLTLLHHHRTTSPPSLLARLAHLLQSSSLAAGRMPTSPLFARLAPTITPTAAAPNPPSNPLRLILTPHRLHSPPASSPPLTPLDLHALRLLTRARVVYALTAPSVAGAIAQSHVFDYRWDQLPADAGAGKGEGEGGSCAPFGCPVGSVEVKLVDEGEDGRVAGWRPRGEIVVGGPGVGVGVAGKGKGKGKGGEEMGMGIGEANGSKDGGEVRLGVQGRMTGDLTLVVG